MNKVLKFNPRMQINSYTCFAASMTGIIDYLLNQKINQKRIYEIAHSAEKNLKSYIIDEKTGKRYAQKQEKEGIGSIGVIAAARAFDLDGVITKRGDFEKLEFFIERDIPVLIDYQCNPEALGESGHYGVVVGIEDKDVVIMDSRKWLDNPRVRMSYQKFENCWHDPCPSSNRWMAAFWKKEDKMEVQFRGLKI